MCGQLLHSHLENALAVLGSFKVLPGLLQIQLQSSRLAAAVCTPAVCLVVCWDLA